MAKVELSYNPYMMQTTVKFNERNPFANSLVENYVHSKLQTWLKDAPQIISDEMNGYDFDLEYYGTKMDFDELKHSFEKPEIPQNVTLFLKNELESRSKKVEEIEQLLIWLDNNRNDNFDFDTFLRDNIDVFDEEYVFYTVHMEGLDTEFLKGYNVSVVNIDSVNELRSVDDLDGIPIFVFIDEKSYFDLPDEIGGLLEIGIKLEQLFFLIKKTMNVQMVHRVIQDLGITEPQIIESESDESVKEYFFAYPVTDRIYKSIQVFQKATGIIETVVDKEKQDYSFSDKSISSAIGEFSYRISQLKSSYEKLKERDNIEIPIEVIEAKDELSNSLNEWKRNKIKINPDSAENFANDYNYYIQTVFGNFMRCAEDAFANTRECYLEHYKEEYFKSKYDDYVVEPLFETIKWDEDINLQNDFLGLKEEQYVEPKADIRDLLFGDSTKLKDLVKETTYYCDRWRAYALSFIMPKIEDYIEKQYKLLQQITDNAAEQYLNHIDAAIKQLQSSKEACVSKLSTNESKLQEDIDWLSSLEEFIEIIERR